MKIGVKKEWRNNLEKYTKEEGKNYKFYACEIKQNMVDIIEKLKEEK